MSPTNSNMEKEIDANTPNSPTNPNLLSPATFGRWFMANKRPRGSLSDSQEVCVCTPPSGSSSSKRRKLCSDEKPETEG